MSLKKGCLTCRDRRIRCDRALPSCGQCVRSKRSCAGYALRLSWPREHDRRRAMLGVDPPRSAEAPRVSATQMVNATSWDFEMREYLVELQTKDGSQMTPPVQPSVSWAPFKLQTEEKDLLQYFESVAVQSLATIGRKPCSLMLRMALSERTPASAAVLTSILALASLHRFGCQLHADRFKVSAVQALAASSGTRMGAKEGMQHVAAGMLLCSFEVAGRATRCTREGTAC
ncbi:hypothetical protein GQ53DRAFT_745569 [Thozetella sp. PMI_491]|nr:hypothetical protein GQ53DRAFT_745569 [Thozetella sp. PMI_491]